MEIRDTARKSLPARVFPMQKYSNKIFHLRTLAPAGAVAITAGSRGADSVPDFKKNPSTLMNVISAIPAGNHTISGPMQALAELTHLLTVAALIIADLNLAMRGSDALWGETAAARTNF